MPIKYYCSDGSRVTEATIKSNLSKAYRKAYDGPYPCCLGCGKPAQCSAHIVPKAILKQMHKTELIWNPELFFPACHSCNMICENVSSGAIKKLMNYSTIERVLFKYAPDRHARL